MLLYVSIYMLIGLLAHWSCEKKFEETKQNDWTMLLIAVFLWLPAMLMGLYMVIQHKRRRRALRKITDETLRLCKQWDDLLKRAREDNDREPK